MTTPDLSSTPNKVLIPYVVIAAFPDQDVEERTRRSREIGAAEMLEGLASGEWLTWGDRDKAHVGEFIGRVVANAERQGIEIPRSE